MRAFGVDPGLRRVGMAVVDAPQTPDQPYKIIDAFVIGTAKHANRKRKVIDDDVDRMNLIWINLQETVVKHEPDLIAVETYTVFKADQGGHGKGAGWKALYAYAMTCAVGFARGIPVRPFRPTDLKRRIGSNTSATKHDIEVAVRDRTDRLDEFLALIPGSDHEHAADAVGHAICALEDARE